MKRYEAIKVDLYEQDIEFKKLVNEYKNYNTIRRDLRNAQEICNILISLHEKIKTDNKFLEQITSQLNI